jgi:L-ribulokinase
VYRPNAADHETYDILYREYLRLHDYFGRGENDLMKVLRGLRAEAKADRPIAVGA